MQLYWFTLSGNSRKAMMCLEEVGADYEFIGLDFRNGEHKQPEYLKLNPNGLVPTLVDGDLVLWESSAILLYLAEKYPDAGLLPSQPASRAAIYKWLIWQPANFMPHVLELRKQLIFLPEDQRDPERTAAAKNAIAGKIAFFGDHLGDGDYLGGVLSVGDIVFLPHVHYAVHDLGLSLPDNVQRWYQRLSSRPSWQQVLQNAA